jgi:hypothetical protein
MCSPKGRDLLVLTRAVRRKWELDMAGELTTSAALQVDLTDINAGSPCVAATMISDRAPASRSAVMLSGHWTLGCAGSGSQYT